MFLLGAERVVPAAGKCHFGDLLAASERVGRELTKEFYLKYAEMREQAFDRLRKDNPTVSPADLLAATQKLLDRVLFCCFAEERGLLPGQTVERAYRHSDPYNPRPIYKNFRGLFRAVNVGNDALQIPAYNGGLFADDPLLETLKVSDEVCSSFQDLADYDFRSKLLGQRSRRAGSGPGRRRGHPRPHLRAVDLGPGKAPRRTGGQDGGGERSGPRHQTEIGGRGLHAVLHHTLHRWRSPRGRAARTLRVVAPGTRRAGRRYCRESARRPCCI